MHGAFACPLSQGSNERRPARLDHRQESDCDARGQADRQREPKHSPIHRPFREAHATKSVARMAAPAQYATMIAAHQPEERAARFP